MFRTSPAPALPLPAFSVLVRRERGPEQNAARMSKALSALVAVLAVVAAAAAPADAQQVASAPRAMVATVQPLATDAAVQVLREGGNAVDAAVTAALTLGVVDGYNSGIGGGCFILIRRADGRLIAIDGRETAPAAAHRDMYLRDGRADTELSQLGPLAAGVPGALAAYQLAAAEHGRLPLSRLLEPGQRLAEQGFVLDELYAARLAGVAERLARFEGSRQVLLKPDGSPYDAGDVLRQRDLAQTYQAIARHGIDWFYRGPFAQRLEAWMAENGGIMTAADLAAYQPQQRSPLVTHYRGHTVVGFPPPSSGGVHVAQILNILEAFDLQALNQQDPATLVHVVAEAMKAAFADRAHWLGDPAMADVPRGLVAPQYARQLADRIALDRVVPVASHGQPPRARTEFFGTAPAQNGAETKKHTTHIAAADAEGNWVAITATVNTTFGCKVILPGTGVVLNNEMDDFSIQPGVPNAFGLVGAEANAIAPGKRPLSSMSPTIVLQQGQPVMTLGAAGGPKIITQVVLGIIRRLDLGMPLSEAVAAPRWHHQWSPDRLYVEAGMPAAVTDRLVRLGHDVDVGGSGGVTQAILWDPQQQRFEGVTDPRAAGKAAGL